MNENQDQNSLGETLKKIRKGDMRRKIFYDEETGDFIIKDDDETVEEGEQDATTFAGEGYA